jgi:hypothetical protein
MFQTKRKCAAVAISYGTPSLFVNVILVMFYLNFLSYSGPIALLGTQNLLFHMWYIYDVKYLIIFFWFLTLYFLVKGDSISRGREVNKT